MYIIFVKKIGNIVTKTKKNIFGDIFNVVNSFDDIIMGIPTLIIGIEEAKKHIGGFNILEKHYGDLWWTFKKTESRCEYEEDIIDFYRYAILKEVEKNRYVYIDPIRFKLDSIKKTVKFLKGNEKKYVFLTRNSNFMFIYSEKYSTVFGLSIELCEYFGVNRHKVFKLLRNAQYVHDLSFMSEDIRKVVGSNTHYLPVLYTYFN